MYEVKHLVIGGGAVGLACAARLARKGPTLLLERNARVGEETSSRNSEVIHAGLYYPENSHKTRLCIEGRQMLYQLCAKRQINHRKIGKIIFSTQPNDPTGYLHKLKVKSDSLGIPTRFLGKAELVSLEPNLRAESALLSPETGIIDSHGLMLYLKGLISDRGSDIATRNCVKLILPRAGAPSTGYRVEACDEEGNITTIDSEYVINTAGLNADRIARLAMGQSTPTEYKIHYLKGYYFSYHGTPLVSRLTYPIPDSNLKSLGIHTTLDLSGRMKLGPDAHWTDRPDDYQFPAQDLESLRETFYQTVKTYLPSINRAKLEPDYVGIRPKLSSPEDPVFRDFFIQEESSRGFPGLVNLVGIESPGLTSSLAIARYVANLLGYHDRDDEFDL